MSKRQSKKPKTDSQNIGCNYCTTIDTIDSSYCCFRVRKKFNRIERIIGKNYCICCHALNFIIGGIHDVQFHAHSL